jgi:hypothetical protein
MKWQSFEHAHSVEFCLYGQIKQQEREVYGEWCSSDCHVTTFYDMSKMTIRDKHQRLPTPEYNYNFQFTIKINALAEKKSIYHVFIL